MRWTEPKASANVLTLMTEPLPLLIENAIQIAQDYLERTGDLDEPQAASCFLLGSVESTVRQGERRILLLSNKAIDAYKRFKREKLKLAS
jgi:hypothetical protein